MHLNSDKKMTETIDTGLRVNFDPSSVKPSLTKKIRKPKSPSSKEDQIARNVINKLIQEEQKAVKQQQKIQEEKERNT